MMRSLKLMSIKTRHQPLLLGILAFSLVYSLYFISKMHGKSLSIQIYWYKNFLVYLNCLAPLLISTILAIQSHFEDRRYNANLVLSLPNRSNWLFRFLLNTWIIWLINILACEIPFLFFTQIPFSLHMMYWASLAVLNLIWLPILGALSLFFNFSIVLGVGLIIVPFTIYYGTTPLGTNLEKFLPWVYPAVIIKIFEYGKNEIFIMITIAMITFLTENLILILTFKGKNK